MKNQPQVKMFSSIQIQTSEQTKEINVYECIW